MAINPYSIPTGVTNPYSAPRQEAMPSNPALGTPTFTSTAVTSLPERNSDIPRPTFTALNPAASEAAFARAGAEGAGRFVKSNGEVVGGAGGVAPVGSGPSPYSWTPNMASTNVAANVSTTGGGSVNPQLQGILAQLQSQANQDPWSTVQTALNAQRAYAYDRLDESQLEQMAARGLTWGGGDVGSLRTSLMAPVERALSAGAADAYLNAIDRRQNALLNIANLMTQGSNSDLERQKLALSIQAAQQRFNQEMEMERLRQQLAAANAPVNSRGEINQALSSARLPVASPAQSRSSFDALQELYANLAVPQAPSMMNGIGYSPTTGTMGTGGKPAVLIGGNANPASSPYAGEGSQATHNAFLEYSRNQQYKPPAGTVYTPSTGGVATNSVSPIAGMIPTTGSVGSSTTVTSSGTSSPSMYTNIGIAPGATAGSANLGMKDIAKR